MRAARSRRRRARARRRGRRRRCSRSSGRAEHGQRAIGTRSPSGVLVEEADRPQPERRLVEQALGREVADAGRRRRSACCRAVALAAQQRLRAVEREPARRGHGRGEQPEADGAVERGRSRRARRRRAPSSRARAPTARSAARFRAAARGSPSGRGRRRRSRRGSRGRPVTGTRWAAGPPRWPGRRAPRRRSTGVAGQARGGHEALRTEAAAERRSTCAPRRHPRGGSGSAGCRLVGHGCGSRGSVRVVDIPSPPYRRITARPASHRRLDRSLGGPASDMRASPDAT